MKFLITIFVCLIMGNLFAKEQYEVSCDSPGLTTENQFDLSGTVFIDNEGIVDGVFSYRLRNRGNDSEIIEATVERSGTIKLYTAGSINRDLEVYHFQFVDQEDELVYMSFVTNHPDSLSSRLRFKDGLVYKSKCRIE